MKIEDDEKFVKLCNEKFGEINSMATLRGTPGSTNVRARQKVAKMAWDNITTTMNNLMNISNVNS